MTIDVARERVARGAAELDKELPGWFNNIDLQTLDMPSPCHCVRGQLASPTVGFGWVYLKNVSGIVGNVEHGFMLDDSENYADYVFLQDAWVELILARRAEPPVITWTHRELITAE